MVSEAQRNPDDWQTLSEGDTVDLPTWHGGYSPRDTHLIRGLMRGGNARGTHGAHPFPSASEVDLDQIDPPIPACTRLFAVPLLPFPW